MSCLDGCRSKGEQDVVEARKKLEEADLVYKDKLTGYLFSLGVFLVASLFVQFLLQERFLEPQQLLSFAQAFFVGSFLVDAKTLVQAKALYNARLKSAIAKYGKQVVRK